jgi:hypothetical protein
MLAENAPAIDGANTADLATEVAEADDPPI